MSVTWLSFGILVSAAAVLGSQLPPPAAWTRADAEILRLSPSRIPGLPTPIKVELDRRGCLIPQPFTAKTGQPQNAIQGRFTSPTSTDWAVLCSRERRSAILVFRAGNVARIDELAAEADAGSLQVTGPGPDTIGYSRGIGVASPRYIRDHNPAPNPPLPVLDHDGIDDAFIEKGSVVWYWSGNRWLQLAGSNVPAV
jgi:hypothetical protein